MRKKNKNHMGTIQLRPHHLLDIVTSYGNGEEFKPHPYGHAVHTVARVILSNVNQRVEFIVGSDEICRPCCHRQPDGRCDDVLEQFETPISKQQYNDDLDNRLFAYLNLVSGRVLTVRQFLEIVDRTVPGIEKVCTHPKHDEKERLDGLTQGLIKLDIRKG